MYHASVRRIVKERNVAAEERNRAEAALQRTGRIADGYNSTRTDPGR